MISPVTSPAPCNSHKCTAQKVFHLLQTVFFLCAVSSSQIHVSCGLFWSAGLTRWYLRIPPFGVLPHLLNGSLPIFPICTESTLSPDKYFRAHSGHILLPRSQWGQELLQSVHINCPASFLWPVSYYNTATGSVSALVRQANSMKVGNWYRKINVLDF